jgi:hypothetical protein
MEIRDVPTSQSLEISSYGSIDCGYKLMHLAWPKLHHRFAVRRATEEVDGNVGPSPWKVTTCCHWYSPHMLTTSPVDLLVVEQGHLSMPTLTYSREVWEDLVDQTSLEK